MEVVKMNENVIEWLTGSDSVLVTLNQKKYISKVKKLAETREDVVIKAENKDGSILASLPLKFIKISPPRQMSEEQRNQARERLKKYRR
jgi:nucleoside-triphosphatase THEP1